MGQFIIRISVLVFYFVCILCCGCSKVEQDTVVDIPEEDPVLQCYQLDPLQKVFQEDRVFIENDVVAEVARGETASFQFVLTTNVDVMNCTVTAEPLSDGVNTLDPALKAFVDYVLAGKHLTPVSKDALLPASDYYPDCLKEVDSRDIEAHYNQPVYVEYDIPSELPAGEYTASVIISGMAGGEEFSFRKQIRAKVYDVTVPEQTLWITNWHDHTALSYMNNGGRVEPFSDRYWQLLTEMAHIMKKHRQNMYFIEPLLDFVECNLNDGQYEFDFSNFDKTVQLFIDEGGLKRIEGAQLAHRVSDWDSDYGIYVPNMANLMLLSSSEAQIFLSQFIPALYAHLEEKGWKDIYFQHIGDEPSEGNVSSYIEISEFVKRLAPSMKIIEAVHSHNLDGVVDVWVPQLDYFDQNYDFYKGRQSIGDEMWFYTCMAPRGNYANRFLELPLVQTRILHWINFKYGATGYLHWGFNQDWKETLSNIATDGYVPGGDTYIVYPAYGKVYGSIRLAAMRDGIADYELLKLLESQNPDEAKDIAGSIVMDFDSYNSNIDNFRRIRTRLLSALEKL